MSAPNDDVSGWPIDPDLAPSAAEGPRRAPERRRARQVQAIMIVAIGCGGVVGALSRYAVSLALPTETGQFPWATFLINVTGSAVLGFLLVLLMEQFPRGHLARPVLGTGVLGGYTTFSTFTVDAVLLARAGRVDTAIFYVLASVVVGIGALWFGMTSARGILRAERWLGEDS